MDSNVGLDKSLPSEIRIHALCSQTRASQSKWSKDRDFAIFWLCYAMLCYVSDCRTLRSQAKRDWTPEAIIN